MSPGLPKFTRTISVSVQLPPTEQAPMIPRPFGELLAKGSETTTAAYQTIATHTVTDGTELKLSKIMVSAQKAAWVKYRWAGEDLSAERLLDDVTLLLEHFSWDYEEMEGDGSKAFDVQAKWLSEAGKVSVEIVGEEVS